MATEVDAGAVITQIVAPSPGVCGLCGWGWELPLLADVGVACCQPASAQPGACWPPDKPCADSTPHTTTLLHCRRPPAVCCHRRGLRAQLQAPPDSGAPGGAVWGRACHPPCGHTGREHPVCRHSRRLPVCVRHQGSRCCTTCHVGASCTAALQMHFVVPSGALIAVDLGWQLGATVCMAACAYSAARVS